MMTNRTGETALHYAVRGGDKDIVQLLIDYGVNIRLAGTDPTFPHTRSENVYWVG